MNRFIKAVGFLSVLGAGLMSEAVAAVISGGTVSQSITTAGQTFTLNQFDPSLGTLTGVELVISSTAGGSIFFTKTGGGTATYTGLSGGIDVLSGVSFDVLFSSSNSNTLTAVPQSGDGTFAFNSSLTARTFDVQPASLVGTPSYTAAVAQVLWSQFVGNSTIDLITSINAAATWTSQGGTVTPNYTNMIAPSTLSVNYIYAVPEPSTYAMTLAGLGWGGYSLWRRRKRAC